MVIMKHLNFFFLISGLISFVRFFIEKLSNKEESETFPLKIEAFLLC